MLYNRRGVSDYVEYDEAGIVEKTGVTPALYSQYAALRGDTSDNLPGVPGVGEKTAAKLITTYGGIDGIYEHVDEQTPKLRTNLVEYEPQVRANAQVMVLVRDVPLEVGLDDLRREPFDREEVRKLFDFLEFRTMHDRLVEAFPEETGTQREDAEPIEAEVSALATPAEAVELFDRLVAGVEADAGAETDLLSIDAAWAGAEGRSEIVGLAFVTDAAAGQVAWVPGDMLKDDDVHAALVRLVGEDGRRLAAHGAKALMRALLIPGVDIRRLGLDTQIAAYLLDPAESRYLLPEILERYANLRLPTDDGPAEGQLDLDGSGVPPAIEAGRRALAVARLAEPLSQALAGQGMTRLNDEIEIPLVRVLARMEHAGVGVDGVELRRLNDEMANQVAELTQRIYDDAGTEFVINSTPQLRQILFEKLGLSPQKRTKTGFSTDAASLQKLAGQHSIIDHLLQYREVEKLRSTYGEGLLSEVQPDGRIRATFNQTVARTGRLSSDAPNLHNIPVRSDVGRAFRKAFIPAAGCEFLIADYNQIELRCIAHLADDPGLIAAFESGTDIHNATASRVFGVAPHEVTIDMRSKAKMVSYGLAYGMESYGLSQRLNIPVEEAAAILRAYFEAFPHVREYMERTVTEARMRGYTETLFGRKRFIAELMSDNFRVRQAGERQAMNAGIQGLAADIFKVALVRLDGALETKAASEPAGAPGPRRGDHGGPSRRARPGRRADPRRHGRRRRSPRAARGQPVLRGHVGRRQGLTEG